MSLYDNCTVTTLTPIPRKVCAFNIGQGQKMGFWLKNQTPFTPTTITTQAAWTAAVTDDDPSPVVVTNRLNNFAIPTSEAVRVDADTNANAMSELLRGGNVLVTATLRSLSPAEYNAYVDMISFSQIDVGETNLVGVIINSQNEVIYNTEDPSLGFDIFTLFVGTPGQTGTLGANSEAGFNFMLLSDWFKGAAKKQLAFNLLSTFPTVVA